MKTETKQYWIIVGCVWLIGLLLSVAAFGLVLMPQEARFSQVHKQLKAGQDEIELARTASLDSTQAKQVEELESLRTQLRCFSTSPMKQDGLVFEVSRLASDLKLEEYAGKTRDDVEKKSHSAVKTPLDRMFLDLKFLGTFDQFARFVNELERNHPVLFIENASIARTNDETNLHQVKLLLSFLVDTNDKDAKADAASADQQTARRIVEEGVPRI